MDSRKDDRFEVLRRLAVDSSAGGDLRQAAETALRMAAGYVGLNAATLLLWNEEFENTLSVTYTESDEHRKRLEALEEDLFQALRKQRQLLAAYLTFGGDIPSHTFTLPLKYGDSVMGAVIGLQEGQRTIVAEDVFLEALSAMLALAYTARRAGGAGGISQEMMQNERLAAIVETAVTVNHEVNNPLTAILGNVQLLLLKRDDLDDELKEKLKVIEEAAMSIKDVTQKLLRMTSAKSKEYTEGTSMLDLSEGDDQ